jgi:tRNA-uridine 2-sulfurtransferase
VAEQTIWHEPVPMEPIRAEVQIRYRHAAAPAWIERLEDGPSAAPGGAVGRVKVTFDTPQPAVTPGQAAVFYREDRVLGGGWIAEAVGLAT